MILDQGLAEMPDSPHNIPLTEIINGFVFLPELCNFVAKFDLLDELHRAYRAEKAIFWPKCQTCLFWKDASSPLVWSLPTNFWSCQKEFPHRRVWRWYQTLRPKNDTKYKNRPVLRDYLSYKIAGSMRKTFVSLIYMYANLWLQPFRTKQDFVWRKSSNLRLQSTKLGWFIKTFHSPGGKPLHIVLLQLKQLIIITINTFWVMVSHHSKCILWRAPILRTHKK